MMFAKPPPLLVLSGGPAREWTPVRASSSRTPRARTVAIAALSLCGRAVTSRRITTSRELYYFNDVFSPPLVISGQAAREWTQARAFRRTLRPVIIII